MKEILAPPSPVFRFDRAQKELTADGTALAISPKAVEVLTFLVEHAGRVVTRQEMVEVVWEGLNVSNAAVRYAVKALRRALGDPAEDPLFIETVARRGWRFVGRVARVSQEIWILEGANAGPQNSLRGGRADAEPFVGRETEMASLLERLAQAQNGDRQTLFLRGEPGIGKSRLLEAFLEIARMRPDTISVRGECVEHIGAGMPYSPLFQVLEGIDQRLGSELCVAMLRRDAPTWLSQMPSLTAPKDRALLEEKAQGATQIRMVREWANVIDRIAADRTIVIAIEDLHWADQSTLTALFYLAERIETARVMIVATLRSATAAAGAIDLQQSVTDLVGRKRAHLVSPSAFEIDSIRAYLDCRFGRNQPPVQSALLCEGLARASAGNPLFLASLVDECVEEDLIHKEDGLWKVKGAFRLDSVPASLLPLIERQLSALEPRLRSLLQAASVVGIDFSAAELASAQEMEIEQVEADCDGLVDDGRFVVCRGAVAWPDGTVSSGYRFRHGLHREVLYDLVSSGHRSRLHRTIAERLRNAFAGREDEVAAELAMHFEQGLILPDAARFYALAGDASARRLSNAEAVEHLRQALKLMSRVEFDGQEILEIRTRLAFCAPLAAVAGYAAQELEQNFGRLEKLTADIEDSSEMFPALLGLWSLHLVRADLDRARDLADRKLALAARESSQTLHLQAHQSAGHSLFYCGRVVEAQEHYERALAGYDVSGHVRQDYSVGDDPLVLAFACQALSCWFLGRTDEACGSADAAVRQGERVDHPPSLALAWTYGAVLHQLRGDAARAWEWSDRGLEITTAEGIPFWMDLCRIIRGWAVTRADPERRSDGIALIRAGIAGWGETGSNLGLPHFLSLLASSLDETDDRLELLSEARRLMEETGQWVFEPNINQLTGDCYRKIGEARCNDAALETAESWYQRAAEVAESRGYRGPALEAWTSLAKMTGASAHAERCLSKLVALYPETTETDLHLERARRLLSR